jgi:hypothetical protein
MVQSNRVIFKKYFINLKKNKTKDEKSYFADVNGDMTIYKRGVDRFTSVTGNATYWLSLATIIQEHKAFCKADELWKSLQDGIKKFVKDNWHGVNNLQDHPLRKHPLFLMAAEMVLRCKEKSLLSKQSGV